MNVFNSGTNVEQYRYTIRQLGIKLPNSPIINIQTIRVKEFYIEENFETHMFPLFRINILMEDENYYTILRNKENCQLYIRIDKYYTLQENPQKSVYKRFINGIFDIIIDDDREDLQILDKKGEMKDSFELIKDNEINELDEDYQEMEMYLFTSAVKTTKGNVNKIFDNITILEAVQYLMSTSQINNLLMAQPDNDTVYQTLIIPPMSILKALSFLDFYYGIYKTGTMIWFGLNNTYIIPYSSECRAYKKDEKKITTIVINNKSDTFHSIIHGRIHNDNYTFVTADGNSMNIESSSISNDYINANDLQTIDSYDGSIDLVSSDATAIDKNFSKFFENKTMNKYISNMYASQTAALSTVISVRLANVDIDDFTPNKQFKFLFEYSEYSKKYNGTYLLSQLASTFSRDGEDFVIDSVASFKKTK